MLRILEKFILPSALSNYRLVKKLGEGRYGKTYLIQNSNEKVVYKKLKKINKKMGHKVNYEMKILSSLNHPNIPKLYSSIRDNKNKPVGYVMEYVEGPTLYEMLNKENYIFSNKEIWQIADQLINIVAYLQKHNVVHRDIRTPNVVKSNDKYYLLDFGLARPIRNSKQKYQYDIDFTYVADFLLYLFYSSFEPENKKDSKPWYEELAMSNKEKAVLKKMFGIEGKYINTGELQKDIEAINLLICA